MTSQAPAPTRLLSLDGGGVRGISSMVILQAIMDKVKELERNEGIFDDSERLPCRYFDLAGGTSTGGLAAIMLFRLEMSTSEVIARYQNMAGKIFSNRDDGPYLEESGTNPYGCLLSCLKALQDDWKWKDYVYDFFYYLCLFKGFSQYSGKGLIDAVDEISKAKGEEGKGAPFLDNSKAKTVLYTTIHEDGSKGVIRSYSLPNKDDDAPKELFPPEFWSKITLQEAARATTSAPFYFPATSFGGRKCVDGGLLNNNPVERVWDARHELGTVNGKAPYVSVIVSLGTAKTQLKPLAPEVPELRGGNLLDWVVNSVKRFVTAPGTAIETFNAVVELATNTEEPHRDFKQRNFYRNLARKDKPETQTEYFRFNAEIPRDRYIKLDNVKGMDGLKADTQAWLSKAEASEMVTKCAQSLMRKRGTL